MRNDPSFAAFTSNSAASKADGFSSKQWKTKPSLSVSKTEVADTSSSDTTKEPVMDPDRQCPLHRKPHSLKKCRGFRIKPLAERKRFLKENFICFKCCASTTHQAKECKAVVRCSECDSDQHISVLHAGPAPWAVSSNVPATEHGGEPTQHVPDVATSSCTFLSVVRIFEENLSGQHLSEGTP